jgi:hypothetical protein
MHDAYKALDAATELFKAEINRIRAIAGDQSEEIGLTVISSP